MAKQRKPYNPNTAYGRRKRREQAQQYYESLPPEKKAEWNGCMWLIMGTIILIALALYYMTGDKGILKWLTR